MCNFLGDAWKLPRKHSYSLEVYVNSQGIYISLEVYVNCQENYTFFDSFILPLKKILSPQDNSNFL
jgi:hypothetical protein